MVLQPAPLGKIIPIHRPCSMKPMGEDMSARLPYIVADVLWMGILWGLFIAFFHFEWSINAQYRFGYLIPFLSAYLCYERFKDRPRPSTGDSKALWKVSLAPIFLLIPCSWFLDANPDYRPMMWVFAISITVSTIGYIRARWGTAHMRHFTPAVSMMLFSVPWPYQLESITLEVLTRSVTEISAECLNFIGIAAATSGNVIEVPNGYMGVEEACSGIRSLGVALAGSWFASDLFRLRARHKCLVFLTSACSAFGLNCVRTVTLSVLYYRGGASLMDEWHDSIGVSVSLLTASACLISAHLLTHSDENEPTERSWPTTPLPQNPGFRPIYLGCILLVAGKLAISLFYSRKLPETTSPDFRVVFTQPAEEIDFNPVSETIRETLRANKGSVTRWADHQGNQWKLYQFRWSGSRISHLSGVHRPEVCLPATGWKRTEGPVELSVSTMSFHAYSFSHGPNDIFVFHTTWGTFHQGIAPPKSFTDRLSIALRGQRIEERAALELIVSGPNTLAEASELASGWLENSVRRIDN